MKSWKLAALLLIALLSACKNESAGSTKDDQPTSDDDPGLPSYPFNFDQETPGDIQIETRNHSIPSLTDIDNWYRQTNECLEAQFAVLSIPYDEYEAPPIIIEDDLSNLCGAGSIGIYCTNFVTPFIGIQSSYTTFDYRETWRHEFIHHILYMNDFDDGMNLNHQPPEIWQCQSYDN
jgi:hypothetical protein